MDDFKVIKNRNALEIIRADHRSIGEKYSEFKRAGTEFERKKVISSLMQELELHTALEEEVFYTAVEQASIGTTKEKTVKEIRAGHDDAVKWLGQLKNIYSDANYEQKYIILIQEIAHHFREEEEYFFPIVLQVMGESELEELGQKMVDFRDKLIKSFAGKI